MSTHEPVRCPECAACNGKHVLACSQQTFEEMRAKVVHYHAAWLEQMKRNGLCGIRLRKEVTLWQGKHALLRHENNNLRKKLRGHSVELKNKE